MANGCIPYIIVNSCMATVNCHHTFWTSLDLSLSRHGWPTVLTSDIKPLRLKQHMSNKANWPHMKQPHTSHTAGVKWSDWSGFKQFEAALQYSMVKVATAHATAVSRIDCSLLPAPSRAMVKNALCGGLSLQGLPPAFKCMDCVDFLFAMKMRFRNMISLA